MDLKKAQADELAQSDARIARFERLVAEASADPDKGGAVPLYTKMLDSERAFRKKLEDAHTRPPTRARRSAADVFDGLLKQTEDWVADAERSVARCERLVAEASADPARQAELPTLAKLLDSSRTHLQDMERQRADQRQRVDRQARLQRRVRVFTVVVAVAAFGILFLRFAHRH